MIGLIIPPSPFLLDERVFVSLGVLKVAAALREEGVGVEVLDLSGVADYLDVLDNYLETTDAVFIGVTATSPQIPYAALIAERVRQRRPAIRLILGGPHGTLTNAAMRKNGGRAHHAMQGLHARFDVVVAGDGEKAILEAMRTTGRLIDADNASSPLFLSSHAYEGSPWPARDLVDLETYHYSIDGARATSLIAQLGCPFGCGFCGGRASPSLRRIRMRSSKNILAEIEALHGEYGYTGFMFYDDELNVNRQMIDLMDLIAGLGLDLHLRGFIKAELFTEAQAEAMVRAGFRTLLVGFESGSDRILKNINKRATREDNNRCMAIARRHGLKVKALMSIGHPGESETSVRDTRDWLLEVHPDDFDVTIITPYPGSPYYDEATPASWKPGVWIYECRGDFLYMETVDYLTTSDYYKGDPDAGYQAYVFTDTLTTEDLVTYRDWLERSVRHVLGIPFNLSAAARSYEHSMGQLPPQILRRSREPCLTS